MGRGARVWCAAAPTDSWLDWRLTLWLETPVKGTNPSPAPHFFCICNVLPVALVAWSQHVNAVSLRWSCHTRTCRCSQCRCIAGSEAQPPVGCLTPSNSRARAKGSSHARTECSGRAAHSHNEAGAAEQGRRRAQHGQGRGGESKRRATPRAGASNAVPPRLDGSAAARSHIFATRTPRLPPSRSPLTHTHMNPLAHTPQRYGKPMSYRLRGRRKRARRGGTKSVQLRADNLCHAPVAQRA